MEIRNALQKIENYLTVVLNLNKTILSEGSMSRDELLLMKKYLYTSIDRIEDIERSLIIDKKDDKSFAPTETTENKFVPAKEKEIFEVAENDHIEDVEATLPVDQQEEMEDMVEDIQAEILAEHKEIVGEVEHPKMVQQKEDLAVAENIITEDYSLNRNAVEESTIVNKLEEPVIENVPVIENIITEDYSLNRNSVEENVIVNKLEEPVIENVPVIENIITEDYSLNRNEVEETVIEEITPIVAEEKSVSLLDKIKAEVENVTETISAKFEEKKPTSLVEDLANKKKEETSFFEQMEQKLNTTPQSQLFQLFDDHKEDLHETFAENNTTATYDAAKIIAEKSTAFEHENESVLIAEKEVQTVIEQLTPSSLNDIFKPQTLVENITTKSNKTLSESIALNDKFIFVRELFGNQFAEYENALKYLDGLDTFVSAEQYCNTTLWNKFNWTERASAAGRFMDLIEKKFK